MTKMISAVQKIEVAEDEREATMDLFGVKYWEPGEVGVYEAPREHLYYFKAFIGKQLLSVERGDSVWYIDAKREMAIVRSGPLALESEHFAVVMRGYQPATRSIELAGCTVLPYVNGCSTKQLIPPPRVGDPTLQYLSIPPFSAEQAHHIHSTVRVVYILKGLGVSIVGMEGKTVTTELKEGMVCILEPMCPHHFETPQGEYLVCMPMHVFSSSGPGEQNHPMFNGTFLMNQGA